MKAITLTQPYAALIAVGEKTIETRSWNTNYRGPLAIHAGRYNPSSDDYRAAFEEPIKTILRRHDVYRPQVDLIFSAVIAVCDLVDVLPMSDMLTAGAGFRLRQYVYDGAPVSQTDLDLGYWSPDRYAFILRNVRPLPSPIVMGGALNLWTMKDFRVDRFYNSGNVE